MSDGEGLGLARESREPIAVVRHHVRQDFEGDIAIQLCVAGAVDLAHPAFTDLRDDFVDAEAAARGEGQVCRDYRRRRSSDEVTLLNLRRCGRVGLAGARSAEYVARDLCTNHCSRSSPIGRAVNIVGCRVRAVRRFVRASASYFLVWPQFRMSRTDGATVLTLAEMRNFWPSAVGE